MDKENIIISIIIVLCIAAAVAAYGLTNSNNPIFSDLSSMAGGDSSGHGPGNNSTIKHNGSSVATTAGSGSSGTSSGGSGSSSGGSGSGSGGSGGGSGGSGGGDSGGGGSGSSTHLSYAEALSIASGAIGEEGAHAEYDRFESGMWIFKIYDSHGNHVDTIGVDDATGMTNRV